MNKKSIESGLIEALGDFYDRNHGEELVFKWEDGTKFEASIVTLSETDNGKELDDEDFEEYHACFIIVTRIVQIPRETLDINYLRFGANIEVNRGIEISYHNAPKAIFTRDGTEVWKR